MFDRFPTRYAGIALIATARIEGHPAHRCLHAEKAAMRRRDANGAAAVGPDGEGRHAGRHRGARARARPTRRHVEVPRIAGRRKDGVVADAAVAEFRHVGLADDDGAGGLEPLDADVVLVRHEVPVPGRPHHGEDVLGGDEVLDADRHAGQHARILAGRDLGVDGLGGCARHIGRRGAECVDVRFEHVHAAQHGFRHFGGGDLLRLDFSRHGHGVHAADVVVGAHAAPPPVMRNGTRPSDRDLRSSAAA